MSISRQAENDADLLRQRAAEGWPHYDQDERDAVAEVLRSGRVNQWTGDKVTAFQRAYEDHVGCGRAIALANGSLALELALRALGIGPGDEVIVTPRSFVASASCVRLVGATPVFADVDRDSGNLTAQSIAPFISPATKAIIPVHIGGWPCDMPAIMALAGEHGIKVIEDCAQAHGASIGDRPVGSFGDAAAFSFCQDKIITTGGEGGLVIFQDEQAHDWAWSYKDHGKSLAKLAEPQSQPGFRWLHDHVGTNWRMLEMSAAIGLLQLAKLERWRKLRTRNALIWADALRQVAGLRLPLPREGTISAYYRLYAYVDRPDAAELRARLIAAGADRGLRIFSGSCSEIYREQAFADLQTAPLPIARELGDTSLAFEVHPTIDPDLLAQRASAFAQIVEEALG